MVCRECSSRICTGIIPLSKLLVSKSKNKHIILDKRREKKKERKLYMTLFNGKDG